MAEVSFSYSDLFGAAFGYDPPAFEFTDVNNNQYTKLGSPNTAKDAFGRSYYLPVTLGGISLPYPVVRIQGKKRIVETSLVNRTGTVKELISMDDYEIDIRGLIISKDNFFLDQLIMQLRDLYRQQSSLKISSGLTDIFLSQPEAQGSDYVVIREIEFPEVRGIMNMRPYSIKLTSDAPFDLVKKTNN